MPQLREVLKETGVPQDDFIVVPHKSYNVVWVDGPKGAVGYSHDARISVEAVTKDNVTRILRSIVRHHSSGDGITTMLDYEKQLWARMHDIVGRHPGHLLALGGRSPGWGKLKLTAGGRTWSAEAGVSTQSFVDVAFRFLRHKEADGSLVADTIHKPEFAGEWVGALNLIYGPQANVCFSLHDAEWITLPQRPSQPIGRDVFLKAIANNPPVNPDITVYLVGTWGGGSSGHSRGTYFDDTGIAVITDNPNQGEIPEGISVFTLTMAHEILHYLREARHLPPGHHSRDRILLSSGIQTLRIDKQLVMDINPPG